MASQSALAMLFTTEAVILVSLFLQVSADCIQGFQEVGHPRSVSVLVPQEPGTWIDMYTICAENFTDSCVIDADVKLPAKFKELCGETLIPVDIQHDYQDVVRVGVEVAPQSVLDLFDSAYLDFEEGYGAFNATSGRWHLVDDSFLFSCVVCQTGIRSKINELFLVFEEDKQELYVFEIKLVSIEVHKGPPVVSTEEKEQLIIEMKTVIASPLTDNKSPDLVLRSISVDNDNRLVLIYHFDVPFHLRFEMTNFLNESANGIHSSTHLEKYYMQATNVKDCLEEVTVGSDGKTTIWPQSIKGKVQSSMNEVTEVFTRRECYFNGTEDRGLWSTPTFWEILWMPCSIEEQFKNEVLFTDYWNAALVIKHEGAIQRLKALPVTETLLEMLAKAVHFVISHSGNSRILLSDFMRKNVVKILSSLQLDKEKNSYILSKLLVQFVTTSLVTAPNDGASFAYEYSPECNLKCPLEPITVSLTNSLKSEKQKQEQFAIQLSDGLTGISSRWDIVVNWLAYYHFDKSLGRIKHLARYPDITMALTLKPDYAGGLYLDADKYFVDFTYDPLSSQGGMFDAGCAAWNNHLHNWTNNGCRNMKASRDNHIVCRCRGKYFLQEGSTLTARYGIFADLNETQFSLSLDLKDHTGLAVSMTIEVILSALALLSIVMSAILFKKWRENPGHKILLHMVMALRSNLVLGFATSLVHFDTESDDCLTVGVFRHYSFLAMFFWMLVLSGLQMKRLTTVAGAKATSHLILKVSLFAWGVPVAPIVILVAWNTRFYRADRFDRGYCYPEGLVFELTVQAPAAIILLVNLGVFIKILRHVFECTGEKKITKHSKNDQSEKLNRLKTSVFIFFLFGFTWEFHFMSEERLIVSEFLFEYLFLMTASFHIFMLALFFIVLQESTRNLWLAQFDLVKSAWVRRENAIRKKP